ncbi:MAG TPA: hypothetical protein VLA35_05450, partial [Thermoleophilia bacterium]|nr:hypothetical protein [Thermoleophilia bacterium]
GEAGRRRSEASHHLLRQGAHLCEAADDVLAVLGLERTYGGSVRAKGAAGAESQVQGREQSTAAGAGGGPSAGGGALGGAEARGSATAAGPELAADARAVLRALRDAPGTAEDLAGRAGLEARMVTAALSALEVEGLAECAPGGVYRGVR